MSGIVLERKVEIGTLASAGLVAVSIADLDTVKATFGVPDTVVRTLKMGTAQTVLLEAFRGQSFTGRISRDLPGLPDWPVRPATTSAPDGAGTGGPAAGG